MQKETLKQKLKRALQEDRAGVEQSDPTVQLYQARPVAEGPAPVLKKADATEKDPGRRKRKNKAVRVRTISLFFLLLAMKAMECKIVLRAHR